MNTESANSAADSLVLESRLSEITRIPPRIDELASVHAIPEQTSYAMDLCLEEVVSNIIRHGHSTDSGHTVKVRFLPDRGGFYAFVVEDTAPRFNPLLVPSPRSPHSFAEFSIGGQGVHLVRQFADTVEYEPMSSGNRLILSFLLPENAGRN